MGDGAGHIRFHPCTVHDGVRQGLARLVPEGVLRAEAGWVSRVAGTDAADLLRRWLIG